MSDDPARPFHGHCVTSGAGTVRESTVPVGIDAWMPRWSHRLSTTVTIARPRDVAWDAMLHVTTTELPFARVLGVLASLGRGARDRARVRESPVARAVTRLGWIILEEVPERRAVVALVVRLGGLGASVRRMLPPEQFVEFAEPGWVKITVSHDFAEVLEGTRVTAELRARASDARTERRLRWAFRTLRPVACALLRSGLRAMQRHADAAPVDGL